MTPPRRTTLTRWRRSRHPASLRSTYLTDAERKAWIAKLMPVHTEMQSRFGKDFIEKIYKASGFTRRGS